MFFDCQTIELRPYFCTKCPFETNILVSLRSHLGESHTVNSNVGEGIVVGSENEKFKKHSCYSCSFETYSIFQFILHNKKCCKLETDGENHCDYFTYKTHTKINLQSHLNQKHLHDTESRWYECDQCSYKTKWKSNLRIHILKHSYDVNVNLLRCNQCIFKTKIESKLISHINVQHTTDIQWFECDHCLFKAKRKKNLTTHIMAVHPNESTGDWLQCDVCDFKTKLRYILNNHHITKHTEKHFKCDKCEFETKYNRNLKAHKLLIHKENNSFQWFTCDQCNFETNSEKRLERHKKIPHFSKKIDNFIKYEYCDHRTKEKSRTHPHNSTADWRQCFICEFSTISRRILFQHFKDEHMNEHGWYECSKCLYKTQDKRMLRRHALIHSDKMNANCIRRDECNFKTEINSRLTCDKDNKGSTEIKLIGCDYCPYKCKIKNNLRKHIERIHPSESTAPWLNCQYCDFTTKSRDSFNRHYKWKHPDKSSKCYESPYETKNDENLIKHEELEIKDEKPFQ